ncbi:MAG: lipase family protein [Actinomycetaceae bacterium]
MLWSGLELVWQGIRARVRGTRAEPGTDDAVEGAQPWWRRGLSVTAAAATLALTLALAGLGLFVGHGTPVPDAFYDAPDEVPAEPGVLLRTEEFDRAVPDGARAWRILYTTSALGTTPALASGILVVPEDTGDEPLPVVTWAHGTTGVAEGCAPSLLDEPFESGALFTLDEAIDEGYAVVATDYIGLGTEGPHAYLVGEPAGHAVLDAVRAAHGVDGLELADRSVVWGHSQGGHAALWAGVLAEDYAPEAGVVGVAAMAPAADLTSLVATTDDVPGGSIFASYAVEGYARTYADVAVDDYVRGAAKVQTDEMATRCLSGPGALLNIAESLVQETSIFDVDPDSGALASGCGRTSRRRRSPRRCCSPRARPTRSSSPRPRRSTPSSAARPAAAPWTTAPTRAAITSGSSRTTPRSSPSCWSGRGAGSRASRRLTPVPEPSGAPRGGLASRGSSPPWLTAADDDSDPAVTCPHLGSGGAVPSPRVR